MQHAAPHALSPRALFLITQACQRAAWKEHHAVECGALSPLATAAPSDAAGVDLLLACRALRAAEQQAETTPQSLTPGFDDAVGTLWHADDASASAMADDSWVAPFFAAQQAARALLPPRFDAADALELMRAGRRNNFALSDDILTPLAAASFPFGALLNHGCDANCVIAYDRDHADATPQRAWLQRVRAVRRIAAGEVRAPACLLVCSSRMNAADCSLTATLVLHCCQELVHSYVDVAATTAQRTAALQREYGIVACGCALCGDGGGERDAMLEGCPPAAAEAAAALQAQAAASNDAAEEQQLLAHALDGAWPLCVLLAVTIVAAEWRACLFRAALCSAGAHPCSLAMLAARRACLHAALAAGDTEQSSSHGLAVAAASARVYATAPHPRAALDALTAGSAAAAWAAAGGGAAAAADAKAALDAALALLRVTAGAGGGAHGAAARQLRDSLA